MTRRGEGPLIEAARELSETVGRLRFPSPVAYVYNPLEYAWAAHEQYLRRYGGGPKRTVFLGMNPGPFGMAQTGVPFGEVAMVRRWLEIEAPISRPDREHPKRPIEGFGCARSEVSGRRLWGLFEERYGSAQRFFEENFVLNYCPLVFMDEGGRNLTPDKLRGDAVERLFRACDLHLAAALDALAPAWAIGVGAFARARLDAVIDTTTGERVRVGQVLHPSPASPAANRGWAGAATAQLVTMGAW